MSELDYIFLGLFLAILVIAFFMKWKKSAYQADCLECAIKLELKDANSNLMRHTVSFCLVNTGKEPINAHHNYVSGSVPKEWKEVKVKVYDKNHQPLRVRLINDKPLKKDFLVLFSDFISPGELFYYTLEYEWERLGNYEIDILTRLKRLSLSLVFSEKVKLEKAFVSKLIGGFIFSKKMDLGEPLIRSVGKTKKEASLMLTNLDPGTKVLFKWSFIKI